MSARLTVAEYRIISKKRVLVGVRRKPRTAFGIDTAPGIECATMEIEAPPSANDLWMPVTRASTNDATDEESRRSGMTKTPIYRSWISGAGLQAKSQIKGRVRGFYSFSLVAPYGRGNRDLDNFIKPLLDLFQRVGITENDKNCKSVRADWGDRENCLVTLRRIDWSLSNVA